MLVLEIPRVPESPDDIAAAVVDGIFHRQSLPAVDSDVIKGGKGALNHVNTLLGRKECLLRHIDTDEDDDFIEKQGSSSYYVDVSVRDGIECSGEESLLHCFRLST